MSRTWLVGEAPGGRGDEPAPALEGVAGHALARMTGLSYEDYLDRFERRNVFETPNEGRRWHYPLAQLAAARMAAEFGDDDVVVFLGSRVAHAFGMSELPLYKLITYHRTIKGDTIVVGRVPHPSGRNRRLNDPLERSKMSAFLKEVASARV